jgi:hypothetical protein
MADTYGAAGGTHAEEAYGDDSPPVYQDPTPTGELSVWPPAVRQIALEAAARCAEPNGDPSDIVATAERFEQYLTTGT